MPVIAQPFNNANKMCMAKSLLFILKGVFIDTEPNTYFILRTLAKNMPITDL